MRGLGGRNDFPPGEKWREYFYYTTISFGEMGRGVTRGGHSWERRVRVVPGLRVGWSWWGALSKERSAGTA
eukprot:4646270-Pyramimonas_sp.AAC.1